MLFFKSVKRQKCIPRIINKHLCIIISMVRLLFSGRIVGKCFHKSGNSVLCYCSTNLIREMTLNCTTNFKHLWMLDDKDFLGGGGGLNRKVTFNVADSRYFCCFYVFLHNFFGSLADIRYIQNFINVKSLMWYERCHNALWWNQLQAKRKR